MRSERKRRADLVRLIIVTRERFPHTPRLASALRRVMWKYVSVPRPVLKRKRRPQPKRH